jgi:hypothetical protein
MMSQLLYSLTNIKVFHYGYYVCQEKIRRLLIAVPGRGQGLPCPCLDDGIPEERTPGTVSVRIG